MLSNFLVVAIIAVVNIPAQDASVVDPNGAPIADVRFSHSHEDEQPVTIWYVSHEKTDAAGRAYVWPMHRYWAYRAVRVDKAGFEERELTRDEFTAGNPTIIVLTPASVPTGAGLD